MINSIAHKYDEFIFDLDNTLIWETDYLFPAYRLIGVQINAELNADYPISEFLIENFEKGTRTGLFDECLEYFKLPLNFKTKMLNCLRTVKLEKPLQLLEPAAKLLQTINGLGKRSFIITNGTPEQQRNKVFQVEWTYSINILRVYYANEFEPKPSRKTFDELNRNSFLINPVYIGDSKVDKDFAINCGIPFILINDLN